MTTKTDDIKLLPLPDSRFLVDAGYSAGQLRDYARAAVEADRRGQPAASAEPSMILKALADLVDVLCKRHYGRMPDEVRAAYERAWAIVFSSPTRLPAAPVAQEPVAAISQRRAEEVALMQQADKDGRVFNAQGHAQAIQAIDFCISSLAAPVAARAATYGPAGGTDAAVMAVMNVLYPRGRPVFEWGHETTPTQDEVRQLAVEIVDAVNRPLP